MKCETCKSHIKTLEATEYKKSQNVGAAFTAGCMLVGAAFWFVLVPWVTGKSLIDAMVDGPAWFNLGWIILIMLTMAFTGTAGALWAKGYEE